MNLFRRYFSKRLSIIGMIHIRPLPGTPGFPNTGNVDNLVEMAVNEASIYMKYGLHGILMENMFDRPYLKGQVGPEITAVMTRICSDVRRHVPSEIPCGVQILAGANHEAVSVALASGLQFIRAECFVFSHVADEGLMSTASAGPLLRFRRQISAEHVAILADIKKKHSAHSITIDVDLPSTAKAAEFFLADGIIVTGMETGHAPPTEDLHSVRKAVDIPVIIGSGITERHIGDLIESQADGAIIGSHFKQHGKWFNNIDPERIAKFMENYHRLV